VPHLRICLERDDGAPIDSAADFARFALPRLAHACGGVHVPLEWGGYISMDAFATKHGRFEPLWQFLAFGSAAEVAAWAALLELAGHCVPGYLIHAEMGNWPAGGA